MADINGFDANTVEPNAGFALIPRGDYDAVIIESEKKETQAGTGHYIALVFQILSGEFQNRRMFVNLNLWNPNDEAVKIAKGDLSAICRAVGVMKPLDTGELHNKPLKISIAIKKRKDNNEDENRIVGFKARLVSATQTAQSQQPVAGQVLGQKAPW